MLAACIFEQICTLWYEPGNYTQRGTLSRTHALTQPPAMAQLGREVAGKPTANASSYASPASSMTPSRSRCRAPSLLPALPALPRLPRSAKGWAPNGSRHLMARPVVPATSRHMAQSAAKGPRGGADTPGCRGGVVRCHPKRLIQSGLEECEIRVPTADPLVVTAPLAVIPRPIMDPIPATSIGDLCPVAIIQIGMATAASMLATPNSLHIRPIRLPLTNLTIEA